MSLKTKLTRLESRLGVDRCPHCDGLLPSNPEEGVDYATMTNEQRQAIACRALAGMYDREGLLDLLAHLPPARRAEHPLPAGEVRRGG